jgi:hypothetical protein
MTRTLLVLISLSLTPAATPGDEAALAGGERVEGRLSLTRSGQLLFVPDKRGTAAGAAVEYRLGGRPAPFRAGPGMRLCLQGGQELTGLFLGLDRDQLAFRTAWTDRLAVPRRAVVALTHLPGWQPVRSDDLTGKLAGWTVQGAPAAQSSGLALDRAGQSLACTLQRPLAAGRVGVNFRAQDRPAGARWVVEAVFTRKDGDRVVRITLAGAGAALDVDAGGLAGTAASVTQADGWRRLWLDFTAGSLRIGVDDDALWWALAPGPGGPLRQVRLACVTAQGTPTGRVVLANFVLERAVREWPHLRGDPGQDELWLAGGDQLFGRVVRADSGSIELKGRFGARRFDWAHLRGWFPRRHADRPAVPRAPVVRVGIRSGLRPAEDILEGTLTALDTRQVKLRHPLLGEVVIERARVAWLRPVSAGR